VRSVMRVYMGCGVVDAIWGMRWLFILNENCSN